MKHIWQGDHGVLPVIEESDVETDSVAQFINKVRLHRNDFALSPIITNEGECIGIQVVATHEPSNTANQQKRALHLLEIHLDSVRHEMFEAINIADAKMNEEIAELEKVLLASLEEEESPAIGTVEKDGVPLPHSHQKLESFLERLYAIRSRTFRTLQDVRAVLYTNAIEKETLSDEEIATLDKKFEKSYNLLDDDLKILRYEISSISNPPQKGSGPYRN